MKSNFEYSLKYFLDKLKISNGVFVDVGANDGITGNLSLDLEKNGWIGILVEPNPKLVEILRKNRTSPVFPYAVSCNEGEMTFYIVDGPGNLHGLSRFNFTLDFENHVKNAGGNIKPYEVKVKKLSNIINEASNFDKIDFLKIDVEGHEIEVLKSFDFDKFQPRLIVTEDNFKDRDKAVRNFLKSKGYEVIARDRINNWFALKIEVKNFLYDHFHAKARFIRWDLKRYLYSKIKKEFKTGNH